MGSLVVAVVGPDGLGLGRLPGDGTPYTPSSPVQIGTPGAHHGSAEVGSWQGLVLMLVLVLLVGGVILAYVAGQRARLLRRRRVRRMAEAAGDHHSRPTGPSSPERVT